MKQLIEWLKQRYRYAQGGEEEAYGETLKFVEQLQKEETIQIQIDGEVRKATKGQLKAIKEILED